MIIGYLYGLLSVIAFITGIVIGIKLQTIKLAKKLKKEMEKFVNETERR